ncbi:MAG TPA: VWA domain-containing protein, partial [Pyrinomonadaceae bacterium]|nr:VWA domain-containing protein [Pyrinomonadaceae bacterium]
MRTARFIRRLIALFALFCVSSLNAPSQQRPDDVVRVNTDLVQTDFMVFDKQGNFVDGLKREQLLLKVEGQPRNISFFDRLTAGSRSEEAQLAAARGTTATGLPPPVPLDRGRTVLFFIDDLHLSPSSTTYTRRMLKQFIERDMKQNDRAEIASSSGQLGFLQQLTDNKTVLTSAADRLRSLRPNMQTAEYPPITEYQAMVIEQRDSDLIEFLAIELLKHEGYQPTRSSIEGAAEIIRERAAQLIEEGAAITTRTLSALRGFTNSVSVIPGRKIVFFISDGFFIDQRRSENFESLQRITNSALRSGVVIYSLDARGLGAGLPDASNPGLADTRNVLSRVNAGEVRASQDVMNALASDSGGRTFFNTNSMPNAVATALKESSTYYVLAW